MNWKPVQVKEKIRIESFYSLFIENKPRGFHFPGETHDFWECRYILKGTVCVSGDDKIYHLKEGDLMFHKPMELHKLYIDSCDSASILIFSFDLKGELADFFENKVFHLTARQRDIMSDMLQLIKEKSKLNIKSDIKEEEFLVYSKEDNLYLNKIAAYLHQLMLSLADSPNISESYKASDALAFQKAIKYMNDNIYDNPTVSEIAENIYLSESGLKRLFAKYAGISIHKYFLKLKFKKAYDLLREGMSVSEVSEKLNFSSQSYFSVSFKRETGINPSKI